MQVLWMITIEPGDMSLRSPTSSKRIPNSTKKLIEGEVHEVAFRFLINRL